MKRVLIVLAAGLASSVGFAASAIVVKGPKPPVDIKRTMALLQRLVDSHPSTQNLATVKVKAVTMDLMKQIGDCMKEDAGKYEKGAYKKAAETAEGKATLEKNARAYEKCLKTASRTFAVAISQGQFPKAAQQICPE